MASVESYHDNYKVIGQDLKDYYWVPPDTRQHFFYPREFMRNVIFLERCRYLNDRIPLFGHVYECCQEYPSQIRTIVKLALPAISAVGTVCLLFSKVHPLFAIGGLAAVAASSYFPLKTLHEDYVDYVNRNEPFYEDVEIPSKLKFYIDFLLNYPMMNELLLKVPDNKRKCLIDILMKYSIYCYFTKQGKDYYTSFPAGKIPYQDMFSCRRFPIVPVYFVGVEVRYPFRRYTEYNYALMWNETKPKGFSENLYDHPFKRVPRKAKDPDFSYEFKIDKEALYKIHYILGRLNKKIFDVYRKWSLSKMPEQERKECMETMEQAWNEGNCIYLLEEKKYKEFEKQGLGPLTCNWMNFPCSEGEVEKNEESELLIKSFFDF